MVFPTHLEIGWTLIGGALLTSALAEVNQRWPGPLEAVAGLVRHRLPGLGEGPFIPLSQAARELFERERDGLIGTAARQSEDPLRWCVRWIAPRFPEIYGRRAPSTVMERIPLEVFKSARVEEHGDRLTGTGRGDYVDVSVRQRAFRAALPDIATTPTFGAS